MMLSHTSLVEVCEGYILQYNFMLGNYKFNDFGAGIFLHTFSPDGETSDYGCCDTSRDRTQNLPDAKLYSLNATTYLYSLSLDWKTCA